MAHTKHSYSRDLYSYRIRGVAMDLNMYKVIYIDWKGRTLTMYLHGYNEKDVEEQAMVAQGVFKISKISVVQ